MVKIKNIWKFWIYIIILILFLFGITYAVTPFEAKVLEQEDGWMLLLNMKEIFIFAVALLTGILIGKMRFENE